MKIMDLRKNLIDQMAKDLKIYRYNDEEENQYLNRLLYSATAVWVIQSTRDEDFRFNYNRKGVSKSYITRKVSKIVSEFIALVPSFRIFLDGLTEPKFVSRIREYYEIAGYIVPVGFDEFVTASPLKIARVDRIWLLIRNNLEQTNTKVIGLGTFCENNDKDEFNSLDQLFYLLNIDAQRWTVEYIKKLKWANASKIGLNANFFDAKSTKNFSKCWTEKFPENCQVTLYKTNDWDYGFAKKNNTDIVGLKIPDWLIGTENNESEKLFDNDVRRFMYGLKAINDNRAKAIVYKKIGYFELKLLNALPTRELITLKFLAWSKKGFSDNFNYIVPNELFETVKNLLEKLSILIEVKEV